MLLLPHSVSIPWLIATAVVLPVTIIIYRLYLHPLAKVPGPRLAAATSIWHAQQLRRGKLFALELHAQYGPVVRIGPNEVMFNSKEASDIIYRAGSPFVKSYWYWITKSNWGKMDWLGRWHLPDVLNFFSEVNMPRYKLQRRHIGQIYSPVNLKKHEASIDGVLQRYIPKLKSFQGEEVELEQWAHIPVLDCLSEISVSSSQNLIEKGSDNNILEDSYSMWRMHSVMGHFPVIVNLMYLRNKLLYGILPLLMGIRMSPPTGLLGLFKFATDHITSRMEASENSKDYRNHKDIIDDLLCLHEEKPQFKKPYVVNMIQANFGAGHDTITSVLMSTITFIAQNPQVKQRLYEEVRELGDAPTMDECAELEFMQICMKEALRLVPVVGMILQRVNYKEGFELHGYYFPPGTIVGCNPWALHRNTDVFGEDAAEFRPERWYDADPDKLRLMERVKMSFGGASRTCPGRHLAELVLYKTIPVLIKNFDIEVSLPSRIEDMKYCFISMVTGVKVRFFPREKSEVN